MEAKEAKRTSVAVVPSERKRVAPLVEVEKPPRKYDIGTQMFALKYRIFGTTNIRICGYEWGADNKFISRNEWYYYVAPHDVTPGHPMTLVPESDISGRISA